MSHPLIYVPTRWILTPAECLGGYPTPRGADGIGVGVGCRLGLRRRRWTPASDPLLAAWYEAVDVPATLVRATQASPTGWAGASWAGSGLGPYTHTAGSTTALVHAALLIVGNRCQTIFTVSGRTAGTVTFYAGTTAGTARSTNATFTEDLTVAGNTTHSFVPSVDFDGVVTVVAVYNLARTRWNPTAGSLGGYLANPTAAEQPWWDGMGVRGIDDWVDSSLAASAWKLLYDGSGVTWWAVVRPTTLVNGRYIFGTQTLATSNHGCAVNVYADGGVRLLEANGTEFNINATSAAGVLANGVTTILIGRDLAGSNYEVYAGGTKIIDATPTTARSSSDPTSTLALLSQGGGGSASYTFDGTILDFGVVSSWRDDLAVARLGVWLRDNVGGTWA